MKTLSLSLGIGVSAFALSPPAMATTVLEEVVVYNKPDSGQYSVNLKRSTSADSAKMLRTLPGANVNSLGSLTGIAQYRGLYGDRVAITLDNSPLVSGGPNAMDAPLSYAPAGMIKELKLTRGIAPVSAGQETVGGHIGATVNRGDFSNDKELQYNTQLNSQYRSVNDASNITLLTFATNSAHKISVLANYNNGGDSDYGDGTLAGTSFERSRYDISYGFQNDNSTLLIYSGKNNTESSGTPALPMDINYIDTDLAGLNFSQQLGDLLVTSHLSYSDVRHGMDNFSFRPAPPQGAMTYRLNIATAKHLAGNLNAEMPLLGGTLKLGADRSTKDQDSTITNPENPTFSISNFHDVVRDISGLFTEWQGGISSWNVYAGVRHNRVEMGAGLVGASGMMGEMGNMANMLSMHFNNADRSLDFDYTDLALKAGLALSATTRLDLGLARKHRAPSYQESYLWLPLPSAGGLADGRSYTGNLELNEEQSDELTLGITWQDDEFYFTPQVFYRDIKDYIQGTPTMMSAMMSDRPALQFNNVDAELYGIDAGYGYHINDNWQLDGVLSYVRGKRKDESDDLYRIAPLNHLLSLQYHQQDWKVELESVLYAKQDKVSSYNDEQETAGYGLVNLRSEYQLNKHLLFSAGIENAFDKSYQDHLAGYNRVRSSDIAVGERLYGQGRNIYLAIHLSI